MYGCNCHIGCFSGSVTRVGTDGKPLLGLSGSVTRVGTGLRGCASMVCSVGKDAFLEVSTDVLWLTPDMLGEEFDIYSNVRWEIEANDVDNGGNQPTIISMVENSTYLTNEYYLKNGL